MISGHFSAGVALGAATAVWFKLPPANVNEDSVCGKVVNVANVFFGSCFALVGASIYSKDFQLEARLNPTFGNLTAGIVVGGLATMSAIEGVKALYSAVTNYCRNAG